MGAGLGEGAAAELLGVQTEGARCGELRPCGRPPGTASELCSLPKPRENDLSVSPSTVFRACSMPLIARSRSRFRTEGILCTTVGLQVRPVKGSGTA